MSQLDPAEWERLADETAAALATAIGELEAQPASTPADYRAFWTAIRELNSRIRTAPAIKLDDKLALQHRMNALCQQTRQSQKQLVERIENEEAELRRALELANEALTEAATVEEVQVVRSDLTLLRKRVEALAPTLRRERRQDLWNAWQHINQEAWTVLNAHWERNERALEAILDEAQRALETGSPRQAKEKVKAFHASVGEHECAHHAYRRLRSRANELWERASILASQKHAAYLSSLERRIEGWRYALDQRARTCEALSREIETLEGQVGSAPTGVAAALLRGQLEERRRTLGSALAEQRDLIRQIEEAETALASR